jgi:hypothetical protein
MDVVLRPIDQESIAVIKHEMHLDTNEAIGYALAVTAYLVRESHREGQEVLLDIKAVA